MQDPEWQGYKEHVNSLFKGSLTSLSERGSCRLCARVFGTHTHKCVLNTSPCGGQEQTSIYIYILVTSLSYVSKQGLPLNLEFALSARVFGQRVLA